MTPITVNVDQLIKWGYVFMHVMFGLVTHYHSVIQVRSYNMEREPDIDGRRCMSGGSIGSFKICILFIGRMLFGFPWFVVSRLIAPIGHCGHWTPEQIRNNLDWLM